MSKRRESYLPDERRVDLCNYRMKNSEDSLTVAEDCLKKGLYRDAINRSFYAIKALLALEEVDFKRHKDVVLIGGSDIPKYEDVIDDLINEEEDSAEDTIPTIVPNFDHSPRSGIYGLIYHDSTPQLFEKHVNKALNVIKNKNNQLLILKSWNEWGEGNYMEPDL